MRSSWTEEYIDLFMIFFSITARALPTVTPMHCDEVPANAHSLIISMENIGKTHQAQTQDM